MSDLDYEVTALARDGWVFSNDGMWKATHPDFGVVEAASLVALIVACAKRSGP